MKRYIKTKSNALTALVMFALSSTMLAQEPIKPRLRPADPKPDTEESVKPKEEGVLRGTGDKPAPAPVVTKPGGKELAAPRGERIPIVLPDKKDPGEPSVVKGEPVKAGDKTDTGESGVKTGGIPKGVRNEDGTPMKSPANESASEAKAVGSQPFDFEAKAKQKFERLEHADLSLGEFLKIERAESDRLEKLELSPNARYLAKANNLRKVESACGNGDFEPKGLNLGEWTGGYGKINSSTGEPDYANFSVGILPGLISNSNAHHTTTNTSLDPNVGIQQTGPDVTTNTPSSHAVRIGNAVNGYGAELISKTFTVTPAEANIRFWYAVVLQNPTGHPLKIQPAFQVRVLSGGVAIPGLVDLGNGSGKLIADSTNPFFKTKVVGGEPLVYKDWSCAQINLSTLVGKTVTVEYVTQDCGAGGHWGYAYIDNVCGKCTNSPTGDIQFNEAKSTKCGPGNICFDYSLPKDGKSTGTGALALNLYQAGNPTPVATLTSPSLTAGTSYCFAVTPSAISGLNTSLSGFDFSATGTFTLGTNITKLTVGNVPDGRVPGRNNDYQIKCADVPSPKSDDCCGGTNLVANGELDIKGEKPKSAYAVVVPSRETPLLPGNYSLTDVSGLSRVCPNWQLPPACKATKDFSGGVMLINGLTNQAAGKTSAIFEQALSLPKPENGDEAEYKICFRYLPLPGCCFDVVPKLTVVVSKGRTPISLSNVSDVPTGCGNLYSASFKAGPGAVNLQILLVEDGKGDGNDLMIDNVSVRQLVAVPSASRLFNLNAVDAGGGNYNITLTAPASLTNPPYNWAWEAWDPATNTVISTVGGNVATTNFGNMNFVGAKQYLFKLKAWSPCHALSGSKQTWSFAPSARTIQQQPEDDTKPEPVKASALK